MYFVSVKACVYIPNLQLSGISAKLHIGFEHPKITLGSGHLSNPITKGGMPCNYSKQRKTG